MLVLPEAEKWKSSKDAACGTSGVACCTITQTHNLHTHHRKANNCVATQPTVAMPHHTDHCQADLNCTGSCSLPLQSAKQVSGALAIRLVNGQCCRLLYLSTTNKYVQQCYGLCPKRQHLEHHPAASCQTSLPLGRLKKLAYPLERGVPTVWLGHKTVCSTHVPAAAAAGTNIPLSEVWATVEQCQLLLPQR